MQYQLSHSSLYHSHFSTALPPFPQVSLMKFASRTGRLEKWKFSDQPTMAHFSASAKACNCKARLSHQDYFASCRSLDTHEISISSSLCLFMHSSPIFPTAEHDVRHLLLCCTQTIPSEYECRGGGGSSPLYPHTQKKLGLA